MPDEVGNPVSDPTPEWLHMKDDEYLFDALADAAYSVGGNTGPSPIKVAHAALRALRGLTVPVPTEDGPVLTEHGCSRCMSGTGCSGTMCSLTEDGPTGHWPKSSFGDTFCGVCNQDWPCSTTARVAPDEAQG